MELAVVQQAVGHLVPQVRAVPLDQQATEIEDQVVVVEDRPKLLHPQRHVEVVLVLPVLLVVPGGDGTGSLQP